MTDRFDWKTWQDAMFAEFRDALVRVAEAHPKAHVYAVGFYGVYRELDGPLRLPYFSVGTEEDGPAPTDEGFWSARFNPADFDLADLALSEEADTLEAALMAEATSGDVAHWRDVEAKYSRALVEIATRLRDEAPKIFEVTDDFACYWYDGEGGPELAGQTIPRPLFEKLFARQVAEARELAELGELGPNDRAAYLVTRFGCYEGVTSEDAQRELLSLGEAAVPALTERLGDQQTGWTAAKVLGQIGVSTPATIDALRERAQGLWFAMALGMLGDHAWLAQQESGTAVLGMCARLKAITAGGAPLPLSYRALENYLDGADADAVALCEEELKPGSSYVEIRAGDVGEALRGLKSKHAVVRWHAASLLGERELGLAVGKQVLPELAERLDDPHPIVRRLAVLALGRWKAAGKPYRSRVEPLLEDPDEVVRNVTASVLGRWG